MYTFILGFLAVFEGECQLHRPLQKKESTYLEHAEGLARALRGPVELEGALGQGRVGRREPPVEEACSVLHHLSFMSWCRHAETGRPTATLHLERASWHVLLTPLGCEAKDQIRVTREIHKTPAYTTNAGAMVALQLYTSSGTT